MSITKTKRFPLLALMLVICAILLMGTTTAYASDGGLSETLTVDEVWLTGDTLHIAVTDSNSGESQTLELNLNDYARAGDEYVTIQATDSEGRTSNSIQFKNPYYVEPADGDTDADAEPTDALKESESSVDNGGNAFTPDGTGTVLDNATDGDGKEFFTVETEDGNIFYLIVDRERSTDNVYLLNAVTEDDLVSLAKPSDGSVSAVDTPPTTEPPVTADPTPEPDPVPETKGGSSTGTIVFVLIAVVAIGGAGYYFKILRAKQLGTRLASDDYEDEPEDFDEDEEMDYADDGEEDEDE